MESDSAPNFINKSCSSHNPVVNSSDSAEFLITQDCGAVAFKCVLMVSFTQREEKVLKGGAKRCCHTGKQAATIIQVVPHTLDNIRTPLNLFLQRKSDSN